MLGEKVSALYPGTSFAPIIVQVNETDKAAAMEIVKDFENPPDIIDSYENGFEDDEE